MVKNHWGFLYRGKLKQFSKRSRRQTDVHEEDFPQSPPGGLPPESTGRTSPRVHREDFPQSKQAGLPPESTGSSFRVCSFGGQVHPVCCAWPGTFSVIVTFTAWWTCSAQPQRISSIQMKWENFRKERAQSSLLFMQITLPTLGVNSPHIHSPIRQRITKCQ